MSKQNILLLDGNSIANRAYFALSGRRALTAPDGTPTGAVFGFLNIIFKIFEEVSPSHVCALFDRKEPTFRHRAYDGYKASRKPMPDELAVQMPLLKEILRAMGVRTAELPGYEADDLIGTLATRMEKEGAAVVILSGDRDGLQLVDDRIRLLLPVTKSGQTTTEVFDRATVVERYGVEPAQLIDVKAIMGDASDNIPGVRGIGEKGALQLIAQYGSLDAVYESLAEIRPTLASKLEASREMAYLSRELAIIDRNAPLALSLDDLRREEPDTERLAPLLFGLGLRSIAARLGIGEGDAPVLSAPAADDWKLPDTLQDATADEVATLLAQGSIPLVSLQLSAPYAILGLRSADRNPPRVLRVKQEALAGILDGCAERAIPIAGFDLKQSIKEYPARWHELTLHDVLIAAYLLSQLDSRPDFARIYEASTGKPLPFAELPPASTGAGGQTGLFAAGEEGQDGDACGDKEALIARAVAYLQTAEAQRQALAEAAMERLACEVEMPLIPVLADMESVGFHIDRETLAHLSADFARQIARLEEEVHAMCGEPFNINSPKQLSEVLFERLGLPGGKRNASGNYSTDAEEMERLSPQHPVIDKILEYRTLSKLRSTFVEGLAKVIDPADGRVHTSFNQAVTATGRLSSSEPNLQNIPVRTETGREIRRAFAAPVGKVLLDADYSQIELRLLAHLADDQAMIEAFLSGKDIHTATACKIFSVDEDAVDPEMRAVAKTVNFSIAYGVSAFGLARSLGIGVAQAQTYIDEYYAEFPGIRTYLSGLITAAKETGYAQTLFGRRRPVPELRSPNRNVRSFGERVAMNTPVQGTAADIMKMAMVRVSDQLRREGLSARLVLQVHDELIVETAPEEADRAAQILGDGMRSVASLRVPLETEVRRGASWFDTK